MKDFLIKNIQIVTSGFLLFIGLFGIFLGEREKDQSIGNIPNMEQDLKIDYYSTGKYIIPTKVKEYDSQANILNQVLIPFLSFLLITILIPYIAKRKEKDESIEKLKIYAISHKIHELFIISLRFLEKVGINEILKQNNKTLFYEKYINDFDKLIKFIEKKEKVDLSSLNNDNIFSNDLVYTYLKNQDVYYNSGKKDKRGNSKTKNDVDEDFRGKAEENFETGFKELRKLCKKTLDIFDEYKNENEKIKTKCKFSINKKINDYENDYQLFYDIKYVLEELENKIYLKGGIKDDDILNYIARMVEILKRILWKINIKKDYNLEEHIRDFYLLMFNIKNYYEKYPETIIRSHFDFENLFKK